MRRRSTIVSPAAISLGTSDLFDEAMANFATTYADQVERDYAALKTAVKIGKIKAYREVGS